MGGAIAAFRAVAIALFAQNLAGRAGDQAAEGVVARLT